MNKLKNTPVEEIGRIMAGCADMIKAALPDDYSVTILLRHKHDPGANAILTTDRIRDIRQAIDHLDQSEGAIASKLDRDGFKS